MTILKKRSWFGLGSSAPVQANDLANRDDEYVGSFGLTNEPLPGDIVAFGYEGGLGHTMVVGLDSNFIGAGRDTINKRSLDYMTDHGYGEPTYRSYNQGCGDEG
ncbi:MAG: hypothetical protein ACOCRK_09565 [bacterium]